MEGSNGTGCIEQLIVVIEDQAFSPSCNLSPSHPLDRRHIGRLRKGDGRQLADGEGERVVKEPNHATARKPSPL